MQNILVTGCDGQLGNALKNISNLFGYDFFFVNKNDLDICDYKKVNTYLFDNKINFIINCAAYTDVIAAEDDFNLAKKINADSLENLAASCQKNKIKLIHISTDYVFDGFKNTPYNEEDLTNPLNNYGKSKLMGEKKILKYNLPGSIIIRTSWLYSKSKNNFVSKILNKISEKKKIYVTDDEIGSPTSVSDLAETIFSILPKLNNKTTEIFHYSNIGECSRLKFAIEINKLVNGNAIISANNLENYRVKRPSYSPLSSQKLIDYFDIKINRWDTSLKIFLNENKR